MASDPGRTLGAIAAALCLLTIWAVGSESHDIQPSGRGLDQEKAAGAMSPAMAAFFGGRPEVALPEALNATDPTWGVAAGHVAPPAPPGGAAGRGRSGAALLATGVMCGVLGAGLLAGAAVAYVIHNKRQSELGSEAGSERGSVWRRNGREVRLGAA